MFSIKRTIPLFLLMTGLCGASQSQAQTSLPLYTATHCVQVKYEMWRNGATYWSTKFETSDLASAQLMLALFESALDDGSLCGILNCGFDWIIVDVRLKTKYEWNVQPASIWRPQMTRYQKF